MINTNITINKMTIGDLDSIKDILESDFDDFWNYNIIKTELENKNSYYIIAKKDETIVGFAGIIDTVDQYEITNIVVKKKYRNEGIGTLLLNNIIDFVKNSKKGKLYLEVNNNNTSAIALYKNHGFIKCGIRKKYYNNTDDAILMLLQV